MADAGVDVVGREAIRLTDEPSFRLGAAQVVPSAGEVTVGDHAERLEPRVMQVLVALARADGEAVSRETLSHSCWGGRAVGDDAINRTLSSLRAVARRAPAPTYEIETLARIGYRLKAAPARLPTLPARPSRIRRGWRLVAAAAGVGALLLVTAVVLWRTQSHKGRDWEVQSYRVVAGSGADETGPSLSPDARYLVYGAPGAAGDRDIYMQALSGGAPVRLVGGPTDDFAPAWGPQGDRIAFVRSGAKAGSSEPDRPQPCQILTRLVPDGPERLVGQCAVHVGANRVSWAPDGLSVVFADCAIGSPTAIVRLDLASGRKSPLTHPPHNIHGDFDGVISPDGRLLAFRRYLSSQSGDIYLQDLRSGRLTRLTSDGGAGYLDWAHDSRNLIVSSERGGGHNLWRVPIDPRQPPQRLLWGLGPIRRASLAGNVAAFEVGRESFGLVKIGDGVETAITTGERSDYSPDYSRSGELAFVNQDQGYSVWLQPSGQAAHRLVDLPFLDARGMRWSPDGKTLALLGDAKGGRTAAYLLNVQTTRLHRIGDLGAMPLGLSWAADGKSLVMAASEPRGRRLWRVPTGAAGKPQPISGFGWYWAEAGPQAVYALREGQPGVWRLTPGSAPVRLTTHPDAQPGWDRWDGGLTWSLRVSGGRLHIWQTGPDHSGVNYWSVPLNGGKSGRAAHLDGPLNDFAIDPLTQDMTATKAVQDNTDIAIVRLTQRR